MTIIDPSTRINSVAHSL